MKKEETGIFETLRTYGNKELPLIDLHLKRFFESAKKLQLKIPHTKAEIKEMAIETAKNSPHKIQRIKITLSGDELKITSQKAVIKKFATLKSVKAIRPNPQFKLLPYTVSTKANKIATDAGYSDALLISEKEEVFECAHANIFWFEGDTLCTRKDQVLPGIIRNLVIKNSPYKIKFKKITLDELKTKEAFITQSVSLISPVLKINETKIRSGKRTKTIISSFLKLVSNPKQKQ